MKHRDYFKFIEDIALKYTFLGAHDALHHMFKAKHGYSIKDYNGINFVTIEIEFYGPCPRYNGNGKPFPELVERISFEKGMSHQPRFIPACIMNFPNRTDSEDNILKLKAGNYYKDVCRLYTQLNETIAGFRVERGFLDKSRFSSIIES